MFILLVYSLLFPSLLFSRLSDSLDESDWGKLELSKTASPILRMILPLLWQNSISYPKTQPSSSLDTSQETLKLQPNFFLTSLPCSKYRPDLILPQLEDNPLLQFPSFQAAAREIEQILAINEFQTRIACIGASGVGKTSAAMQVASRHYSIYFEIAHRPSYGRPSIFFPPDEDLSVYKRKLFTSIAARGTLGDARLRLRFVELL